MEYTIENRGRHLDISISASAEEQDHLLEAFMSHCKEHQCHSGNCSNPTNAYQKVDRISIHPAAGGVLMQLIAKAGEQLEALEIEPCLDHNFGLAAKGTDA